MLINLKNSILLLLVSVSSVSAQSWTQMNDIPGGNGDYHGAFSFQISNNIFVGGGETGKSLYMYDMTNDTWTYKGLVPGCIKSRYGALGFALNNKGYVAFGEDIDSMAGYTYLTDLWEFDPVNISWTQLTVSPTMFRFGASVFVINNKAYIAGGFDTGGNPSNTTWLFDGSSWTQKSVMPVANHAHGSTFVLNGKGYVACGYFSIGFSGIYTNYLYEYDPTNDMWTQKADFPGLARYEAFGFTSGNHGYCGLGSYLDTNMQFHYLDDIYAYDASTDTWGQSITNFPAFSRQKGISVSVNNGAYIGTGWNYYSSTNVNVYYRDWYLFTESPTSIEDISSAGSTNVFPDPCKTKLYVSNQKLKDVKIYNSLGKFVWQKEIDNEKQIDVSDLNVGIYYLRFDDNSCIKLIKLDP